jgi:hypothetical protein
MNVNKVYIPHVVKRLDRQTSKLKPALDFSSAARYGQLTEVIDDWDDILLVDKVTANANLALANFTEDDYLLAVGDPTVIAICAGILFKRFSHVKMLKWDRRLGDYLLLKVGV